MGFDVENITPKEVRIQEYYRTEPAHEKQDREILRAVELHKSGIGASGLYIYFQNLYPLTSIRRSLNTLLYSSEPQIYAIGKSKSLLFNSTETLYKYKENPQTLF